MYRKFLFSKNTILIVKYIFNGKLIFVGLYNNISVYREDKWKKNIRYMICGNYLKNTLLEF